MSCARCQPLLWDVGGQIPLRGRGMGTLEEGTCGTLVVAGCGSEVLCEGRVGMEGGPRRC